MTHCHAGAKKYGKRTSHVKECMFETEKTGARPLKVEMIYPACSLLICDPETGEFGPLTDPSEVDLIGGITTCGENLCGVAGPTCSVGIVLKGCANLDCVNFPATFSDNDIELLRRKSNCCIQFEKTHQGMPDCPTDDCAKTGAPLETFTPPEENAPVPAKRSRSKKKVARRRSAA